MRGRVGGEIWGELGKNLGGEEGGRRGEWIEGVWGKEIRVVR